MHTEVVSLGEEDNNKTNDKETIKNYIHDWKVANSASNSKKALKVTKIDDKLVFGETERDIPVGYVSHAPEYEMNYSKSVDTGSSCDDNTCKKGRGKAPRDRSNF